MITNPKNASTACAASCGCTGQESAPQTESTGAWFRAPVDVIETDEGVTVRADVPGVSPESVSVHVRGDTLELHAPVTRTFPDGARVILGEYGVGDWKRVLRLAPTIDAERITARCKDGVLEVRLPRRQSAQKRRIEVHPS